MVVGKGLAAKLLAQWVRALTFGFCREERHMFDPFPTHQFLSAPFTYNAFLLAFLFRLLILHTSQTPMEPEK